MDLTPLPDRSVARSNQQSQIAARWGAERIARCKADAATTGSCSEPLLPFVPDRPTRRRALEHITRVLRPGATAILSDYNLTGEYAEQLFLYPSVLSRQREHPAKRDAKGEDRAFMHNLEMFTRFRPSPAVALAGRLRPAVIASTDESRIENANLNGTRPITLWAGYKPRGDSSQTKLCEVHRKSALRADMGTLPLARIIFAVQFSRHFSLSSAPHFPPLARGTTSAFDQGSCISTSTLRKELKSLGRVGAESDSPSKPRRTRANLRNWQSIMTRGANQAGASRCSPHLARLRRLKLFLNHGL